MDSATNKLYSWNEQKPTLLNPQGEEATQEQLKIIEQEKYRRWLKEWLLYKDKELQN